MPSLAKRQRLNGQSPFQEDVYQNRARNDLWLKSRFESIFAKYERNFDEIGDEIELDSGRIVVNNGHLLSMHDEYDVGRKRQVERHTMDSFDKLQRPSQFTRLLEKQSKSYHHTVDNQPSKHFHISTPTDSLKYSREDDVDSLLGDVPAVGDQSIDDSEQIHSKYVNYIERGIWTPGSLDERGSAHFNVEPLWQVPPLPVKQPMLHHPITPPSVPLTRRSRTHSLEGSYSQKSLWTNITISAPQRPPTQASGGLTRVARRPDVVWTKTEIKRLQRMMRSGNLGLSTIASHFPEKPKGSVSYRLGALRRLAPSEIKKYICRCPDNTRSSHRGSGLDNPNQLWIQPEKPTDVLISTSSNGLDIYRKPTSMMTKKPRNVKLDTPIAEKGSQIPPETFSTVEVLPTRDHNSSTDASTQVQPMNVVLDANDQAPVPSKGGAPIPLSSSSYVSPYWPKIPTSSIQAEESDAMPTQSPVLDAGVVYPEAGETALAIRPQESRDKAMSEIGEVQRLEDATLSRKKRLPKRPRGNSIANGKVPSLDLSGTPLPIRTKPKSDKVVKTPVGKLRSASSHVRRTALKPRNPISTPKRSRPAETKSSSVPQRISSQLGDFSEDELSTPTSRIVRVMPKSASCKRLAVLRWAVSDDDIDDLQL